MLRLNMPLCSTLCMPIDKALMDEARCGAVSQAVNGCAAHSWCRVLTRLKTCSLVTLFTT
jgi:hypothetical protein